MVLSWVLASAMTVLVSAQAPAPLAAAAPVEARPTTPMDDFGPPLKAWLDAVRLRDKDGAARALASLQRLRSERNLSSVDEVAGAIAGRAEVRAAEGDNAEAAELMASAVEFAPDDAAHQARLATFRSRVGDSWAALGVAWNNPLESGRLVSALVLCALIIGALIATGFSLGLLLRYAAVFSHDVAEGLPAPLKSLALFMAVLFLTLPLAGLLGWGYLPFWWAALFYIFQSRAEKVVSIALLVALALSSALIPQISFQRSVDAATTGRHLYGLANGGTSAEGEALVRARLASEPEDPDWALLSASLSRRAGRFADAAAALSSRAGSDPRFAHNAAALELNSGNLQTALPGLTQASEASLKGRDKATALYNLSLVQANTLAFEPSKESRKKGDAVDAALLARFDRLFAFDRDGSRLQAPPDVVPDPAKVLGTSLPVRAFKPSHAASRLTIMAVVLLLLIPVIVRFRGVQSFSKQCPKCGTTFCWLCQTRSTSQEVCSQCHHLFVVKRGIPPAARNAKNAEIARFATRKALLHRLASLAAPGSGHISVGHFAFGFPVLMVWAVALGAVLTLYLLAPLLVASSSLGAVLMNGFGVLAFLTYLAAQIVKPKPPVVATVRRVRSETEE